MLTTLYWSLVISIAINLAMFLIAFRIQSDKLTDGSYAISFIALSSYAFPWSRPTTAAVIGTALVCLWALRIGSFLLYRVLRVGVDHRFDGMREHFWRFGKFWIGQAFTVWVLMIPITLASSKNTSWHILSLLGIVLWLPGLLIESIADFQKYRFTHDPRHKGHWIDSGVWHYSRHPNYFGEIIVWIGIYLYALPSLSPQNKLIALVSPVLITMLLLFVSGIPILEKSADKRWGDNPTYRAYKKRTSLLIPLPIKRS